MEKLSFYDLKKKKKFMSNKYTQKTIKGRRFAIAKGPSGNMCYRILGMAKKKK